MEKIMKKDIAFSKLTKIKSGIHTDIFHDYKDLYKLFKRYTKEEIDLKHAKLNVISIEPLPSVICPDKIIHKRSFFSKNIKIEGYIQNYVQGESFYDYFTSIKDVSIFLKIVRDISLTLKKIHEDPRNIVIGDLQFDNILIDGELNHYFIDVDSFVVDTLPSIEYPCIFSEYAKNRNYYKPLDSILSKETDKLCLMLSTFGLLFDYDMPDLISLYRYDEKSEKIKTLKEMKSIFLQLTNKDIFIPNLPYMHELINEEDLSKQIIL